MNDLIELGETIKRRNIEIALKRNPTAAAEVARLKARIAELEAQLAAATSTSSKVGGAVPCAPSTSSKVGLESLARRPKPPKSKGAQND